MDGVDTRWIPRSLSCGQTYLAHGHNSLQAPSIVRALLQMSPTHVLYMCAYIYIYMQMYICLYMYSGYEGMDGPVGLLICGLVCLCVCVVV